MFAANQNRLVDTAGSGAVQVSSDIVEGRAGVGTDCLNCGQANDDDQSEHHSVFNSRGTIFRNQKTTNFVSETLHDLLRFLSPQGANRGRENCDQWWISLESAKQKCEGHIRLPSSDEFPTFTVKRLALEIAGNQKLPLCEKHNGEPRSLR